MTNILIKLFIKNSEEIKNEKVRQTYAKLSSIVGIICNIILSAAKILVGFFFSSIAILADGINNLSDASSSVITYIGFKMANKPADKDHPYGHARYEYIAGLVVSFLIIMLGVDLIESSIAKVINPDPINFSVISVVILILSIFIKLWMSLFNRKIGHKIESLAILATAQDSINDVFSTTAVLISLLIGKFFGIQLDAYMGIAVSLFIIYSGIGLIKETLSPLLGEAPGQDMVKIFEDEIVNFDESILGIHDLVVHNYGPNRSYVTVHAEVPASQDILKSHDIIDNIENHFYNEHGIHLVIHMDPVETDNEVVNELRESTKEIIKEFDETISMHDFRVVMGETHNNLIFDVVVPFGYKHTDEEVIEHIASEINKKDNKNFAVIKVDKDYTGN